tara:strand:+ start:109 stop:303 length:195 start_codon:yes stop_codon:yes gene_type:complete
MKVWIAAFFLLFLLQSCGGNNQSLSNLSNQTENTSKTVEVETALIRSVFNEFGQCNFGECRFED